MNALRWTRLGLLDLGVPLGPPWTTSHAMLPVPVVHDDRVRLYFSSCDDQMRGRPYVVEVDPTDPCHALAPPRGPLLDLGDPGCFDQDGVLASSVVRTGDETLLYYVGFERCTGVRYRLFTGLAVSVDDGVTFVRHADTPVLDRVPGERFFRCGPEVRRVEGGFRIWYVAGDAWTEVDGKPVPVYDIRTATSPDGRVWPDSGERLLTVEADDEHGFGRPWPICGCDAELLLVSVRRRSVASYRIGAAIARNGGPYERCDELVGLEPAPTGFDAGAMMYLATVETAAGVFGFYNGNGFGADGIGVVRLENPQDLPR